MSRSDALREIALAILADRSSGRFADLAREERALEPGGLAEAVILARIGEAFLRGMAEDLAWWRR